MAVYLFIAAIVIGACILCSQISARFGIPFLLAFILLGMFFGSDGVVKIRFDNFSFAETICSISLILIMFYGGFGTNWKAARPSAPQALLLSSLGVVLTAGVTGAFCHFVLRFEVLESFLIGAVTSSTDAASVFSILRSRRLNLKYNTASLLEVESGSNDPFSYMLTGILLSIMGGESVHASGILYAVFSQIVYGAVFGVLIAVAARLAFRRLRTLTPGFDAVLLLAVAVLSYTIPEMVGGNGYLSAYIAGILLGNSPLPRKQSLVHFFDGATGLLQMAIFFLLGLLSFPSQLPGVLVSALLIALALTFVARPVAVFLLLAPFGCKLRQMLLVSWSGLRGASSIVFAIMATVSPAYTENDVFHIVFCIVLFSILLQGTLLPAAARRLHMLDDRANVLRTFTDYTDERPVHFIQFSMTEQHPWNGKAVREICLPPETILILLIRGEERIVPHGGTRLQSGDALVLGAQSWSGAEEMQFTELIVDASHPWVGKPVQEIAQTPDRLIIMIRRGRRVLIPRGKTVIQKSDVLVFGEKETVVKKEEKKKALLRKTQ